MRVVNSGFDIGSNEVLTAMLDISPTSSGTYVLTPLSTLAARMMSFDSGMKKGVAEKIIADAVGVTLSDAPNTSLLVTTLLQHLQAVTPVLRPRRSPYMPPTQRL